MPRLPVIRADASQLGFRGVPTPAPLQKLLQ
jgi:hypothetical protein